MQIRLTIILLLSVYCLSGADYYWVGGSGNWSDISHWAAVSGGTIKYPTAPTSEDNVYFDENSFTAPNQEVRFNNEIIFCKSMDWSKVTNNPTIAGPRSVNLSIFGNLTLSPNMKLEFKGKFLFTGEAEQKVVNFAGQKIEGAVTFAGESTWSVESDMSVDSMLEISRGNVDFNGLTIECNFFHINTEAQKSIDIENSNILIKGAYRDDYGFDGDGSISFYLQNVGLELQAAGSTIEIAAEDATFYHLGPKNTIQLNNVSFTATSGSVYMTSRWFDESLLFSNLSFSSSAHIEGTIFAEQLSLGAGGRYRFEADRTYQFGSISSSGDCAVGIIITSSSPGFPATFQVNSGTVDLNFVTLRDIHGSGGATLNANNGVDLGNNLGWNFSNASAIDYYWIGGSGLWNEPQHWSLSSGGGPSGCVPSGKDNAIFDVNSFTAPNQSVRLNSRATFVHDMIWRGVTGNPEFAGTDLQRIVMTGSLELDQSMEHNVEGYYDFESDMIGNTIRMNGNTFNHSISFAGVSGEWRLLDDVDVYRRIYFNSGSLITDGNQLTMSRFESNTALERTLDITDSYLLLRESQYLSPEWTTNMENYELIAANSTIEFSSNGIFQHNGYNYGIQPIYNILIFNNESSVISSINNANDESIPAITINDLSFTGRGTFTGSSHIRLLKLADGFSYAFDSGYNRKQVIEDIMASGSCDKGMTFLLGTEPGNMANIQLSSAFILDRMFIQDINVLAGSLSNNNSLDGGNNNNMVFNEVEARTLYWVGESGSWQDPSHWSLTSGGPSGECIPSAIDDVIFDTNSFMSNAQLVESVPSTIAYCHDIIIEGTIGDPRINLNFLMVNGSLTYDMSFQNNINEHIFIGNENTTISLGGQVLNDVRFRGSGTYDFADDFLFNRWNHDSGTVNFNETRVQGASMYFYGGAEKYLNLGKSSIILEEGGESFNDRSDHLIIDPGSSTLTLPANNAGIFSRNDVTFNKVIFPNTQGIGFIASRLSWDNDDKTGSMTVRNIQFNGDGQIIGNFRADSLIGVPGKVYILDSERKVEISEYLQLRGNNCTPIELRASSNAVKSTIEMPSSANVVLDFVQMKDIKGIGGADFNAGSRSVDVGKSNVGWIFADAPDFIELGFLGLDRAICQDEAVELTAYSYSPNEEYLWSNGSTDSLITIYQAGTYFVEVRFESECVLRDTITILDAESYEASLPDQSSICGEGTASLDAKVDLQSATYLWSNGSTDASIEIGTPGKYTVEVKALGCITKDSTMVDIIADPGQFLAADNRFCEGEEFEIAASIGGDSYLWKDSSQRPEIKVRAGGDYWLDITLNGCIFRDSISLSTIAKPNVELGKDTLICSNESITIQLDEDYDIEWQDGSTSSEYNINQQGKYVVTASKDGCTNMDSFTVSIKPAPDVDLGEDITICASEEVILIAPEKAEKITWDNGSDDQNRLITDSGAYWLEVISEGCLGKDSVMVDFLALPMIELGEDLALCENEQHFIKPESRSAGDLTWQDGTSSETYELDHPGLITATVFDGVCSNTDSLYITFKECTYFDIYIPTAFSPNDDGYNDVFQVFTPEKLIIESYTIQIFDRWGNRVFTANQMGNHWDGSLETGELGNGIYIYRITIDYIDEEGPGSQEISGDIAIVR